MNIIDNIEIVRSKNNKNWMDLLRLAYKLAPQETIEILKSIYNLDSEISKLVDSFIRK